MYFFDNLIFSLIVISWPMLVYLFYSIKKTNLNEKKSEFILESCLFVSFALSIYYNFYYNTNGEIILTTLPILLAFLHKKTLTSIAMSVILLTYVHTVNPYNQHIMLILIIIYYILYGIYLTRTFKNKYFINIYCLITIIFIILSSNKITSTSSIILTLLTYYITSFLIYNYLIKTKELLDLHIAITEVEKEKHIQKSLFKITHEIKNPLAVVKGYISMFNPEDKEKSKKYIKIIENEIDRSLNILDDFKEFSKINIEKETMSIMTLLDDIKLTMLPFFKAKNIEFEVKCEDKINIEADYKRLKQVIINLLKNSAEACNKKNSKVSLTSFIDDRKLFIIVKDNGIGMDKDTLDNLSTPFFTTKQNGTGLGVCLSKEIIEAHNGIISYTSICNISTTAKIMLPIK